MLAILTAVLVPEITKRESDNSVKSFMHKNDYEYIGYNESKEICGGLKMAGLDKPSEPESRMTWGLERQNLHIVSLMPLMFFRLSGNLNLQTMDHPVD